MNERLPQGGDRPLSERLPSGYFFELAYRIRQLGDLTMGHTLANPMAPSTVLGRTVYAGQLVLELSFDFAQNAETGHADTVSSRCTVSERLESDSPLHADSEIWLWRQFALDLRRRRKEFKRGASIVTEQSEIVLSGADVPQKTKNSGPLAWRMASRLDQVCTRDDYHEFMDQLNSIYISLRENEL